MKASKHAFKSGTVSLCSIWKNEKCKMNRNFYYAKFRPFGIYKKAFHF